MISPRHTIWLTREQGYEMVKRWCAPHLWPDRWRAVDRLFDFEEMKRRLMIQHDPLQSYPDTWPENWEDA